MIKQFKQCLDYYKTSESPKTIKQVYEKFLCTNFYTETTKIYAEDGTPIYINRIKPANERPSYRQLQYYFAKHLSEKDRLIIKNGKREHHNNNRILTGSSDTGVYAAYDLVEMDAVEFNVSLVDVNNRDLTVGRPIIYMMKDVATRMIVAASVAFDNNSNVGCINCFANLNEDKEHLCNEYEIQGVTPAMWPTGYKPRRLRFDNGSDFISEQVGDICKQLNIQRDIVPPASGSMKAVIERSFRDAHDKLNHHFEGYGHITRKHDSNHHKEATITIHEFIKMFYRYIITYNCSKNSGIALTRDMIHKNVRKIPAEVFQYYLQHGNPQMLPNGDEFLKVLLNKGTASIARQGIIFKELNYLNMDDDDLLEQMQKYKSGRKKLKILFDPRSINIVYYISNGVLNRAWLNTDFKAQRTYLDMTFKEYEEVLKSLKELNDQADEVSISLRCNMYRSNQNIIDSVKNDRYASPENLRENREKAKQQRARELGLEGRIGNGSESQDTMPAVSNSAKISHELMYDRAPFMDDESLSLEEKLIRIAAGNFEDEED